MGSAGWFLVGLDRKAPDRGKSPPTVVNRKGAGGMGCQKGVVYSLQPTNYQKTHVGPCVFVGGVVGWLLGGIFFLKHLPLEGKKQF